MKTDRQEELMQRIDAIALEIDVILMTLARYLKTEFPMELTRIEYLAHWKVIEKEERERLQTRHREP